MAHVPGDYLLNTPDARPMLHNGGVLASKKQNTRKEKGGIGLAALMYNLL